MQGVIEAKLRREFQDAGDTLERVIALHLPGQIQAAFDRYVAAARAMEGFKRRQVVSRQLLRIVPADRCRRTSVRRVTQASACAFPVCEAGDE